jgi:4-hydroxybenzoate polyprenyltransferase
LESSRIRGPSHEAYEDFYGRLHAQIEEKDIKPENITNMDEHGMQELDSKGGKVKGTSLTSSAYVTSSDGTTWVSVIEAGTAEGRRLSPVVIFTGASLQGQWFPPGFRLEAEFPDWRYDFSSTGWSNAEIALKWLKEVYLVETKPKSPSEWRLLILDDHSSHISVKFMFLAHRHKVQLLYLPAHTSHKTQPLDRSVFSALKNYFRQNAKALAGFTASAAINKQRFLYCYKDASARGMAPRNIISGFRATGIWPYDPSKVQDDPEAVIEDGASPHCHPHHERLHATPKTVPLQLLKRAKMFARLRRRLGSKLVQQTGLSGPCSTRSGGHWITRTQRLPL